MAITAMNVEWQTIITDIILSRKLIAIHVFRQYYLRRVHREKSKSYKALVYLHIVRHLQNHLVDDTYILHIVTKLNDGILLDKMCAINRMKFPDPSIRIWICILFEEWFVLLLPYHLFQFYKKNGATENHRFLVDTCDEYTKTIGTYELYWLRLSKMEKMWKAVNDI